MWGLLCAVWGGIVGELTPWEEKLPEGMFIFKEGLVPVDVALKFLFFLKSLLGSSTTPIESTLAIILLLWAKCPSSKLLASFKLLIFWVIFSDSTSPKELIWIWKSYIQLIRLMGSFVSILEIKILRKGEMGPGKWSSLLLRTSMRFAMELDWKGHIPKIISKRTTPKDQISALLE